jgi:signal transduction histidine kinase/ligand-binding sensor domain-containing protein
LIGAKGVLIIVVLGVLGAGVAPVSLPLAGTPTGQGLAVSQPLSRQYIQTTWTVQEGLPQNSVNAILQTRDGYLWLGTFGGLARFDGVKFTVFNSANTPGMRANRILSLYEDRAGALWIGTETGEVMTLKDGRAKTFTTSDGLPGGLIWCFYEDHDGALWIGSTKGLTRWQQSGTKTYTKEDGLAGIRVWSIYEDHPGHFWLGTDEGLTEFSNGRGVPRDPRAGLRVVRPGDNGALWLGGTDLACLVNGRLIHYPQPEGLTNPFIRALTVDRAGNIWAGYFDNGVLCRWQPRKEAENRASGSPQTIALAPDGIRAMYVDTEGNIWVGIQGGGLVRLKERRVMVYASEDGLHNEGIQSVTDDGAGGVWATTSLGLVHIAGGPDHQLSTYMETKGLGAVYRDRDGVLWFGADGLIRFSNGAAATYSTAEGLSNKTVHSIVRDNDGILWVGTENGLNEFREGRFVTHHVSDGLSSDDIRFILIARDGSMWLGTVGGLSHFQGGIFTNYTTEQGLSNNYVRSIFQDDDGALWIGTYGGGLDRFKNGRFVHVTAKDGLFDPFISQIIDDGAGRLWMLSNHGIFHVARQELNDFADGRAASITCVSYGVADGMKSSEGNGGNQSAGWRAADGKLWFATIKGLVSIDPVQSPAMLPPVVIEDVVLDREPLPSGQAVRVPPGKENLEIHYTGLSFTRPDQIRFRYKLIGLDKDWIDAGTRRAAYYSHIPPGHYTFSVMAASSDGIWNPSAATLTTEVVPPFYRTWWFLSLVLAAAVGMLSAIYWRRVEQLKKGRAAQEAFSKKLLESQEKERQRIAAELHDGLGQSLLIIKNRAWIASNSIAAANGSTDRGEETREQLMEITDSASQAIEEVREIAFNLRPYQLNRFGLTRTLQAIFNRFSDPGRTVFSARIDPIDGLFAKDDEISIYRIVQEAINNIVKHAGATEATLTVTRRAGEVEFAIHDNGHGFDPMVAGSRDGSRPGFGLTGMAERVRMLGGVYSMDSAPGQGATITIKLNTTDAEHED